MNLSIPSPTVRITALFSIALALVAQEPQSWSDELDAVRAAPNSHKVLFENAIVRVLEVRVPPGTKEPFHQHHLPSIFINLDAGGSIAASRYYNEDGKMTRDTPRTVKPVKNPPEWRIQWMKPEPLHAIENTETVESSRTLPWRPATLRVEFKSAPTKESSANWSDELDAVRVAPNSHRVLFENAIVRVLEVRVPPGTKEPFHQHHWPSIFINLDAGGPTAASRYYNQEGKMTRDTPRRVKPVKDPPEWRIQWMKPEPLHAIENTETLESAQTLPWRPATLRVEFKSPDL